MTDQHDDDDFSLDQPGRDDPLAIDTKGVDIRGTVFIIPLDAPLPNELADLNIPTGSLYKRLAALDMPPETEFGFVPVKGDELLALDRPWRALCTARKVAVLAELPGARYDVLFTQAKRMIGLRTLDWPAVSEALTNRVREVQRTKDSEPWNLEDRTAEPTTSKPVRRVPKSPNIQAADRIVPPPVEGSDEETD